MEKSLHMSGNQYNLAASMFYVGYLSAQPLWTYLLGRFPAGKVLGISCVLWGISVLTMVANKSFTDIMFNRFFLGALEAAVTPGLSLMVRPSPLDHALGNVYLQTRVCSLRLPPSDRPAFGGRELRHR